LEKDQTYPRTRSGISVYADDEGDVKVLDSGSGLQNVMVNGSWPEKSLLEGDIVLALTVACRLRRHCLIEEEGRVRLGVL
jgi:hypothetical protein